MKIILVHQVYIVILLGSVLFCNHLLLAAQDDIVLDMEATGNISSQMIADLPEPDISKEENTVDEIHSSFEDVAVSRDPPKEKSILQSDPTMGLHHQHVNIATELSESGQAAVIYTLAGSELPQQAASAPSTLDSDNTSSTTGPVTIPLSLSDGPPLNDSQYIVRAAPRQPSTPPPSQEEEDLGMGTLVPEAEKESNDTQPTAQTRQEPPPTPQEDIPSFSEWAQKQLAEAEKRKGDNMTGGGTVPAVPLKARHSKNYASTDCGAKVLASNPEAGSAWAVLSSSRDEYLLNKCNARIWFIVELCEAIQPTKIEIANFELFSSSPREFSVWLSDRFPSRDWALAGRFTGQDERTIQAFNISHTAHFGKYVKVEVHSHYGQEHYCPISLFRVYGTSEIEVLDTVDEESHHSPVDDEDDDLPVGERGDAPTNLFGSARDAVLSIVKKAAEVLAKAPEEEGRGSKRWTAVNKTLPEDFPCITPSHLLVCVNCSDDLYNKMYELMSCRTQYLEQLLTSSFIQETVLGSEFCAERGLDLRVGAPYPARPQPAGQPRPIEYLQALLPSETLTALCNLLAVVQKKVVLNVSQEYSLPVSNETAPLTQLLEEPTPVLPDPITTACLADGNTSEETLATRPPYETPLAVPSIRPSRTIPVEDIAPPQEENITNSTSEEGNTTMAEATVDTVGSLVTDTGANNVTVPGEKLVPDSLGPVGVEDSGSLDSLFSELEQAVVPSPRVPPTVQKESVFVRLANRIKALERNMSLSSQYLEELSRRYKKQVEEMQRALAAAVEERRRGEERETLRLEQLSQLTQQVDALASAVQELLSERDSWQHKATVMGQHGVIVVVEVIVFAVVLYICRWLPEVEVSRRKFSFAWPRAGSGVTRRKSVDEALLPTTTHKKRRPSEEALVIAGSTHQELLIPDVKRKISKGETRRQRRKRKRDLVMQSEDRKHKKPSLLDTNSTESVAGWWEEEGYSPVVAAPPPPPPHPDVVVTAAPGFVQTAVAQRQDRIPRGNSELGEKEIKTFLPIKKTGPFKKIVKKFF